MKKLIIWILSILLLVSIVNAWDWNIISAGKSVDVIGTSFGDKTQLTDGIKGNAGNYWGLNQVYPHYIIIDLGSGGHCIGRLEFNYRSGDPNRGPKDFWIEHSFDNITYTNFSTTDTILQGFYGDGLNYTYNLTDNTDNINPQITRYVKVQVVSNWEASNVDMISEIQWGEDQFNASYCGPETLILINVTSNNNNSAWGVNNLTLVNHNITLNVTHNTTGATCTLNDTKFTFSGNTSFNWYFSNNTVLNNHYDILAACNISGTDNGTTNIEITVDYTSPTITALNLLSNNQTVVFNGSFVTQINFSDDRGIYSINITLDNFTTIYDATNIGLSHYEVNLSYGVDTTKIVSFNATVCDIHTAFYIEPIENKVTSKKGLKYIKEKKFFNLIDTKYIEIYPEDYNNYVTAATEKKEDRYTFSYIKNKKPDYTEVFIIESSHYIDIVKNSKYKGHLVIKDLNQWVDFENPNVEYVTFERINDYKIRVLVHGLDSEYINFNSVGELNCISNKYWYNNLNPVYTYDSSVLIGETNYLRLNLTKADNIELNTTLYYNLTATYLGSSPNYTNSKIATNKFNSNSTLIPLNWVINAYGVTYNTTIVYQNITNVFLDTCSAFTTLALNFTFLNETDSSKMYSDVTADFDYTINNIQKTLNFNYNDIYNFSVCVYPSYVDITSDYTITYSENNFPSRRYTDTAALINNISSDINLYLLSISDGITVRFRTLDVYENPIRDVTVTAVREVSGVNLTVEQESTDDSGLATFFLNPDYNYYVTFSKTGYTNVVYNLRPSSSDIITITMVQPLSTTSSYDLGMSFNFYPSGIILQNNTKYIFSVNHTSTVKNITACTFSLINQTDTIGINMSSTTCNLSITHTTGVNETITSLLEYAYNPNITVSTQYAVEYTYTGQFSLKNFIDDVKVFGEAGFDDFGRMLIAFVIIFSIVAMGYKQFNGLNDPESLIILIWVLVTIFSYLGFFTLNYSQLRTVGGFNLQKWFIWIITTLLSSTYIIKRHTE